MNVGEIIKNSLRYPFSDWKKILILGFIIVVSEITSYLQLGATNNVLIVFSVVLVLIAGFLVDGYTFRIIKSSLEDIDKLPEFNKWQAMLTDGFKVFIVFLAYVTLPLVIILSLMPIALGIDFSMLEQYYSSLLDSNLINPLLFFTSEILTGLQNILIISNDQFPIILFYFILIIPIFFVAVANMAYEGKFKDAFRLLEIINILRDIGLIKLIKWYALTIMVFLILYFIGFAVSYILFLLNIETAGIILNLILIPIIYIFFGRTIALIYLPEELDETQEN